MTETLEYKILKYLSENDNGQYVDVSFIENNLKLLKSKLSELVKAKYIKKTATPVIRESYFSSKDPVYKIQIAGRKYLAEIEPKKQNKDQLKYDFSNSTIGQVNQSDFLTVEKTEIKQTIQPAEKEKQQNTIAEKIGKWFWHVAIPLFIGIILLAIQQKWFT
ncbi:hypothetical protein [Flavobacterium sp. ZB4R12]|uniref:hypothetical protein n=1 Tax=Flavobacterium sp. ZB4R12 TaxID=3398732 RepID=UPI003AAB73BA